MIVFPENMNALNLDDPKAALAIVDQYVRYMTERIDFSISGLTKDVAAAGVSNVEIYEELQALKGTVSAMSSTVNAMTNRMSTAEGDITGLKSRVDTAEDDIDAAEARITTAEGNITYYSDFTHLSNADDLQAIEALTGTAGLLKKTAANAWALDTTSYVPASRTVNGHALSSNISLTASDVGAAASSHNQALSTITGADDLKAIEALTGTTGYLKKTGTNTWTLDTSPSADIDGGTF